jgi:ABC-2 type transport system permease protein
MGVLFHLVRKEFLQLKRDPKMLRITFLAPAIQLIALGYAANLDVTSVPTLLVDADRSAASRELVESFISSGYFELVGREPTVRTVDRWLVTGRAQVVLVIEPGFAEAVASGRRPRVQLLADGSDSTAATIGVAYARSIVARHSAQLIERRTAASRSAPDADLGVGRIEAVSRVWYNPDLRSRWFYVPAVLALVLMVVTMMLSSMGVVREKELGTMEQLIVTPIGSWQLILGKLLPFAIIGVIDMFLITAIAVGWFGVPLQGSLALLLGLTALFLVNTLGLGLLVSTLVATQRQAMMAAAFVVMIPMIYLSGLLFPIENMPATLQGVSRLIPLTYYAEILRGIFLKGSGLDVLWPQATVLAIMGGVFLSLAALRFRKRLD